MPPDATSDTTIIGDGGIDIAVRSWPGTDPAPGLVFVHATGFCKEVWDPVVDELTHRGFAPPGLAIDQRGHGDSGTPPPPFQWNALGRDVTAVLAQRSGPWIGVGHSSGGAALAMAEIDHPGAFVGLMLIEPIIFPGPHARLEDGPMSTMALRRRDGFDSPEAAYRNFHGRGPFARWDERALRAYIAGGFRRVGSDDWRLKCSPRAEAEFYREGNNHDTWERLSEIGCPVEIVAGAESTSHPSSFNDALSRQLQSVRSTAVSHATHLVPMERPAQMAELIIAFVGRLDDRH